MSEQKVELPQALRELRDLVGDLEDRSVWSDTINIMELRARLEPLVDQVERSADALLAALERKESK